MPSCSVKGCTNYDRKYNKQKDGISFYRFPTDPFRNVIWCHLLRKQRGEPLFKSNPYLRICSAHFTDDDVYKTKTGLTKLKKTANPKMPTIAFQEVKEDTITTNIEVTVVKEEILTDDEVEFGEPPPAAETLIESMLKRKINKLETVAITKNKKIRALQTKNNRLMKRNVKLQNIIKDLMGRVRKSKTSS